MMKTMKQEHEGCNNPIIASGSGGGGGDANNVNIDVEKAAESLSLMAEKFLELNSSGGGGASSGGIDIASGRNSSIRNSNMIKWNNENNSSATIKRGLFVPADFDDNENDGDYYYYYDNGSNIMTVGFQNNAATAAATGHTSSMGYERQQQQQQAQEQEQEQEQSMKQERSTPDESSRKLEPYSWWKPSPAKLVKEQQQQQQLQPPSSSSSRFHVVSGMDVIVTSPYEEHSNAEVGEELFDRVKKMLEPYREAAGGISSRRSTRTRGVKASPEAQKYFTVNDNGNVGDGGSGGGSPTSIANKVVETSTSIQKNDPFFYINGWQNGSIGDKQIGKIPSQFLLLCLKEWRIGTSNKSDIGQVLKRLIKELDLYEQFTEAINTWLLAWGPDVSKKYRILGRLKIDMFKDGDSDCLKCAFFILRAWTCFKVLRLDKGQEQQPLNDSLKSKILSCLEILKRTYKQKIKGNNSSSSNKKSKKKQQQSATTGQTATTNVVSGKSPNGDHWKDVKVGSRIRIYWELDERYYRGYVSGHKKGTSQFHIKYDDGDEEWRDLKDEVFKIGSPPPPAASKAMIATGIDRSRGPSLQAKKESPSKRMVAASSVENQKDNNLSSKTKLNPVSREIADVPRIDNFQNVKASTLKKRSKSTMKRPVVNRSNIHNRHDNETVSRSVAFGAKGSGASDEGRTIFSSISASAPSGPVTNPVKGLNGHTNDSDSDDDVDFNNAKFSTLIIDRNGDEKTITIDEPEKMIVEYFYKISRMGGGNGKFMPYSQFNKQLGTIKEYVAIASAARVGDPVTVLRYLSMAYQTAENVIERLKWDEVELISPSNKRQKTSGGGLDSAIV